MVLFFGLVFSVAPPENFSADALVAVNLLCLQKLFLKMFLVVQNFSKALRIGFVSFNLSSLDKGC